MRKSTFFYWFAFFSLVLGLSVVGMAQGTFARLTGTVSDANGAAVAGAAVTLVNEQTNVTQTAQTSESGVYVFDSINIGNYRVEVEKQGFKKFVSSGNIVNVSQVTTVDVRLETGNVTEVVNVESAAELVQTSSSGNIGNTVEQRALEALPIVGTRGRNPLEFINFQPGVAVGSNTGGGVHVNGARDRAFNFTLDGIDINETSAGGSNFTPLRPNPDSIQEFQVITSNFTADQGRSSGAQVALVTRAGTNDFRGNAFWFYQTPDFNANEYENNLNSVAKRQFVQHIFGGSFGGPIIKDKAFFFTNLQFLRAYETRLVTRTVYTQLARQGIFRYVAGGRNAPAGTTTSTAFNSGASVDAAGNPVYAACPNPVPTTGFCINTYNIPAVTGISLDPTTQQIIALAPLPNNFAVGDGLNTAGFNFAAPQREKQYDFSVRGDYNINERNALYLRYAQGEQNTIGDAGNVGLQIFPDTPRIVDTFRDPKNLAINHRWSPTSSLTNEFIFGINRFSFSFNNPDENRDANPPFAFSLVANPLNNTAEINNARSLSTNQFVDNLTYIWDDHTFKTGINFRFGRHKDQRTSVAGELTTLQVSFNRANTPFPAVWNTTTQTRINSANDQPFLQNMINELIGSYGRVSQAFVADGNQFAAAGTPYFFDARFPEYDFYAQDTWKLRPNLTLDLGLRWEIRLSPRSEGNPILRPDRPVRLGELPTNQLRWVEGKLFDDDYDNLSPSLGFAWDPLNDGKTSVRANYRLAYDRMNTFVLSSSIFQSSPGLTFGSVSTSAAAPSPRLLRNGLPSLTPTNTPDALRQPAAFSASGITVVDPNLQYPETHQWSLSFQREIGFGLVAEANYIGRRAVHLFGGYDVNQVDIFNNGFLAAFNAIRANRSVENAYINQLLANDSRVTTADGTPTRMFVRVYGTELTNQSVATIAANLAQGAGGRAWQTNTGNPFFFQPYPQFSGSLNVLDSNDYSRYNALELIVKRRFEKGLGFQLSYTLARSKDTRSFDPAFTTVGRGSGQSASSSPFDNRNRNLNYARSDFDRRHAFQGTFVYELPFGRGRQFGSDIPRVLDFIAGGWQLAGIWLYYTGRPFTVFSGSNTVSNVVSSTANCNGCSRDMGRLVQEGTPNKTNFWFGTEQQGMFSVPTAGELGNTERNFFYGPRTSRIDLSVSKLFKLTERQNFELRADIQNLTNNPSFANPNAVLISTAPFGRIRDSVTSSSRRIQVAVKLNF